MNKPLSKQYKELFHYTTAEGLEGIIRSQTLRATHYRYLNDTDEFSIFFKGRLSELIREEANLYIANVARVQDVTEEVVSKTEATARVAEVELLNAYSTASKALYEPYLLSFCGVNTEDDFTNENGLLSQWRGYGQDGGYAIVFDTKQLEERFKAECANYLYLFNQFGCVDYIDPASKRPSTNPETLKHEANVREGIANFFTPDTQQTSQVFDSVLAMSCSQKHIGFYEEKEVRVVVAPLAKKLAGMIPSPEAKQIVDYDFRMRNGVLVPYITLFKGENKTLPIIKIIVGPHTDKERRQYSVERLLSKYGVNVEVTTSQIPYTEM
jgi:hypothetical protein